MKTNFDNIRKQLIDRTNSVMKKTWRLRSAAAAVEADRFDRQLWVDLVDELDDLERCLDTLRGPVVAIGCLESDGEAEDAFKALDFDLHAARKEDDEDGEG